MTIEKNPEVIKVRGARTHNLKNINIDISLEKITCIAGPSGSGKSSLAFHTLLTESKRRFINSLPTDMKFFWEIPHTVEVDSIYPVLPAWGLPQHNPVINSRPVALDVIGGHERVQKVFMELGSYVCSVHKVPFTKIWTLESVVAKLKKKKSEDEVYHLFAKAEDYKRSISNEIYPTRSFGKELNEFSEENEWYELFRVKDKDKDSILKKFKETKLPDNTELFLFSRESKEKVFFRNSVEYKCHVCGEEGLAQKVNHLESLSPLNALGACPECEGHGMLLVYDREKLVKDPTKSINEGAINFLNFSHFQPLFNAFLKEAKKNGYDIDVPFNELPKSIWDFLYKGSGKYEGFDEYFDYLKTQRYKKNIRIYMRSMQTEILCGKCEGTRVSEKAGSVSLILDNSVLSFKDFLKLNFNDAFQMIKKIKADLLKELTHEKLLSTFLKLERLYCVAVDLGLGHIQNTRKVRSMSSSEYQRILLSKYLSYEGSQSLFVLDEPSLGLTLSTQKKLMEYLRKLRDQGNTILLVEHSEYLKSTSDQLILMGPFAGGRGGEVLYQGPYKDNREKLPKFLFDLSVDIKKSRNVIELYGAVIREQKKEKVSLLKNAINWVYGESGTGKTSFIVSIIANEVHKRVYGTRLSFENYEYTKIKGINDISDVIVINSSLDRISSRSSVATYTDLGGFVRKYFASLPVSKTQDLKEGHFSSNSELGQCASCEGRGVKLVEMHFMEDVEFICEDCQGKKLKSYYANISDGKLTAYEAFSLPLSEVLPYIRLTPKGKRIWEYFKILKLDYLSLDRTLTSLSGGERQRLQLLTLLDKKIAGALIIFENLTSGLSHHEYAPLAELLHQLSGSGNTVVVIDQNAFFKEISSHSIEFKF
jgi:excinuclease ABC subunit A